MVEDKLLTSELTRLNNKAEKLVKKDKLVQDNLIGLSSAIKEYSDPILGGYQDTTLKQDIDGLIANLDRRIDYLLKLEEDK